MITGIAVLSVCAAFSTPACAGRPMLLDDAGVEDAGAGHVEAWFARGPAAERTWTVAPAFSPVRGLELGAALARSRQADDAALAGAPRGRLHTLRRLQAKYQFAPLPAQGQAWRCGAAATASLDWPGSEGRPAPGVALAASCPFALGTLHMNAGAVRAPDRPDGAHAAGPRRLLTAGGVAWEVPVALWPSAGLDAVAHAEWVVARGSRPLANAGLRVALTPAWQIDGSLGRGGGRWLASVGVKRQF